MIRDLVENATTAKEWLTASLAVNWAMEQLTDNAVSIYVGQKVMTFIEQPDGSYTAPPGMTASLAKENGLYVMQERHGKRYEFDASLNLAEIEDQHGNTLTFAYNSQTNLQTVTSSFDPVFNFEYTGDLLTRVYDNSSSTREVRYQYDSNNNLTNFVDAAGFDWGVGYDSEHRVKWMKDPEQVTTIQNFYNSIGQVTTRFPPVGMIGISISREPAMFPKTHSATRRPIIWIPKIAPGASSKPTGQEAILYSIVRIMWCSPSHRMVSLMLMVYDIDHNLLSTTNAVGLPEQVVSAFGYDAEHHLRFVTNAVGTAEQTISEYTYTPEHKVDTITVAEGTALEVVTDLDYFSNGLLQQRSEGNGKRVTTFTFDGSGNPDTVASTDAGTIDYLFDLRGDLRKWSWMAKPPSSPTTISASR